MSLPVTRLFGGTTGAIPNGGDEDNWAYNRTGTNFFTVATGGWCQASDNTVDIMMHWTADSFNSSQYSEVILGAISITGTGVGRGYGPCVRMDTGSTQKTGVRLVLDSHGWELSRFNNAIKTTLGSDTTAPVKGDRVRLSVVRSGANDIFTLTKNSIAMVGSPFTDTSPLSNGSPGVSHSSSTSTGGLSDWGIDSVTLGNAGYTIDVTTTGAYTITGPQTTLRPGSTTYLRYRK